MGKRTLYEILTCTNLDGNHKAVIEVSEDMVQNINVGTSRNAKKKATKKDLENMQETINSDIKKQITDLQQTLEASMKEYLTKQNEEYINETEEARLKEEQQTRLHLTEMADEITEYQRQSEQNMQRAEQKMQIDLSAIQMVIVDLGNREIQNRQSLEKLTELQRINGEEQERQRQEDREQRQHTELMMEKLIQNQMRADERFYAMMDRMLPRDKDLSRAPAVDVIAPVTPEFHLRRYTVK